MAYDGQVGGARLEAGQLVLLFLRMLSRLYLTVCALPMTARLAGRGLRPVNLSRLEVEVSQAAVILQNTNCIQHTQIFSV